jgi:hypothetical protein
MKNYFYGFNLNPEPVIEVLPLGAEAWARRAYLELVREEMTEWLNDKHPGVKIGHVNTLGPNQILT